MKALKVGWAAPWNPRSAIAQSASETAFELARRGHAITVLRTETGDALHLPPRSAPGPIEHISDVASHDLDRRFDVVIAHIGDNFGFHGAVLPLLGRTDVIGVFHDACIGHLLQDWVHGDQAALRCMMFEAYRDPSSSPSALAWSDPIRMAQQYPMIEWIARRTVGAVAHAHYYADRLRNACPGPVDVIPLAFTVENLPPPPPLGEHMTIAVVGHANPNKRIEQVILAVGASYLLRGRCRIRIIGEITPGERERLTILAERVGIATPECTGWVSNDDLRRRLRDVDVIACLRNPVLEGASASLILALTSGRPTLIEDHGCYAEVPKDAALVCSPNREVLDVMRHLERLVRSPGLSVETGRRGQAFVAGRHSAQAYVDRLEPFLQKAVAQRPLASARCQLNNTLAEFGLSRHDPAVARVAAGLSDIVGEPA